MSQQSSTSPRLGWFWLGLLILLTVAYRLFVAGMNGMVLSNTTPLMALCFGGGLLLGFRFVWVPPVLLIVSDLALGLFAGTGVGAYTLMTSVFFFAATLAGAWVGKSDGLRGNWFALLFGTLGFSVLFYVVANTFSWVMAPEFYAQTFAGWWQSQTVGVGLPGMPPSTFFLKNALLGDAAWCLLAGPFFYWKAVRLPSISPATV